MTTRLTVGDRIFNHGDMANASHFGTVESVIPNTWGVESYGIKTDDGERYTIDENSIDAEYKGHAGTRIVRESAYRAFRARSLADAAARMERTRRSRRNVNRAADRLHAIRHPK